MAYDRNSIRLDVVPLSGGFAVPEYIAQCDSSLFYTTAHFMALISGHLHVDSGWLVARAPDDQIAGVIPFAVRQGPLGPVYNSLAYYGSNGGVIQKHPDDETKEILIRDFYDLAEKGGAASATIITNPLLRDSGFYEGLTAHDFRDERIGQITHFPASGNPEDLIASFDDPRPRNIRRAEKSGVLVEGRRDAEALDFLYRTHAENMRSIGGRAKDPSFFSSIPDHVPDSLWTVYVASIGREPVAALLLFYFNETVEYFTPVIVEEFRNTQALALIIYRAMCDAMRAGYKNWNWGGTWLSQGGVYDFKKRWGTNDYPYYYYTKLYNKDILLEDKNFFIESYNGFYVIPFSALKKERNHE